MRTWRWRVASAILASLAVVLSRPSFEPDPGPEPAPAERRPGPRLPTLGAGVKTKRASSPRGQLLPAPEIAKRAPAIFPSPTAGLARFSLRDRNVSAFFHDSGLALRIVDPSSTGPGRADSWGIRWGVVGARPISPRPEGQLEGRVHWLVGDRSGWKEGLPTFSRLAYDGVLEGIDLVFDILPHGVEYAVLAAPGFDPGSLRFRYDGARSLRLAEGGDALEAETDFGPLREEKPRAFQVDAGGVRREVPARYGSVRHEGALAWSYSIDLGPLDPTLPAVIDPGIVWSSLIGGTALDEGRDLATDATGNVYTTGRTGSTDFPGVTGRFDDKLGAAQDVFVAKTDSGGALLWATYLGANGGSETGEGIAVDGAGNVYVAGRTDSNGFVPLPSTYDDTWGSGPLKYDGFVIKLAPTGASVQWWSYLGGSGDDFCMGVILSAGGVFVSGSTGSPDFPVTRQFGGLGANDCMNGGTCDAFLVKFTPAGAFQWSVLAGGSADEQGYGVAADTDGGVFLSGGTQSTDFSVGGAGSNAGLYDAFLLKATDLVDGGVSLAWLRLLGGSAAEQSFAAAADPSGSSYIAGPTSSANLPATGFQTTFAGTRDAFVAKFDPAGNRLWSSYLGGSAADEAHGVAVDSQGRIYLAGYTESANLGQYGFDKTYGGLRDAFVARVASDGSRLDWAAYLGGSAADQAFGVTAGPTPLQVSGWTASSDFYPGNVLQGSKDAFLVEIAQDLTAPDGGVVNDGVGADIDQQSGNTISANWSGFADPDTDAGIAEYHWAIGTGCGLTDVRGFASVGNSTSASAGGLPLASGTTYYLTVRAFNQYGERTDVCSDGVLISGALPLGSACAVGADCASGYCADGVCCGSACSGDCEACSTDAGAGSNGACSLLLGTYLCRAAADLCDSPEYCPGWDAGCPPDQLAPPSQLCRGMAGSCDVAEYCTGADAGCPPDTVVSPGQPCRGQAGPCDLAEYCTGIGAACPADVLAAPSDQCRPSAGACDFAELCTGTDAGCPPDLLAPSIQLCRGSAGICDVPEYCTGSDAGCPTDSLAPSIQVCRAVAGICDLAEYCTGADAGCPADLLSPPTQGCRPQSGPCDVAEYCSGVDAGCPADLLAAAGQTCRILAGPCDLEELCTGVDAGCPADLLATAGTQCRAAAGSCDLSEYCSGVDAGCPPDVLAPVSQLCRASAGVCDLEEYCSGADAGCPSDSLAPSSQLCRAAVDLCDQPELCTGADAGCPPDTLAPLIKECRAAVGPCDSAELCTGLDAGCPADLLLPAGSACRPAAGVCDLAELCTGASASCPADAYAAASLVCRAKADVCDIEEQCTGTQPNCPADAFAAVDRLCRPGASACDVAEYCTGTGALCPADSRAPDGQACSQGGRCSSGTCVSDSSVVIILENANPSAVVGRPYVYNAAGAVLATGAPAIQFDRCGGPPGFLVERRTGSVSWLPAAARLETICVSASNGFSSDSYTFNVDVEPTAPPAPKASMTINPSQGPAPLSVSLDGTGSAVDPGAVPLFFRWAFGDGSPPAIGGAQAHTYLVPGGYRAELTVLDSRGGSDSASAAILVADRSGRLPPSARIVATQTRGAESLSVGFSCDCQPGSAPIAAYRWELANGESGTGPTASATYGPGKHHVELVVIAADGLSARDEVTLTVTRAGDQPPDCLATAEPPVGQVPLSTLYRGWSIPGTSPIASMGWELGSGGVVSEPVIRWSYEAPGEYRATFRVQDAKGLGCKDTVTVLALSAEGDRPPAIVSEPATEARCLSAYRYSPALEGPVANAFHSASWSATEAPDGLAIDPESGALSWTPTVEQLGAQRIVLRAENSAGAFEQAFEVAVECPPVRLSTSGCGCGSGAVACWAAVALAFLAWRRRRVARIRRSPHRPIVVSARSQGAAIDSAAL
ncbi:MAG: SBBP repeat-containing protein [Myxococcales bacterium]|nr:SBBP repeat-containing protein [Myxococcales bacterium]